MTTKVRETKESIQADIKQCEAEIKRALRYRARSDQSCDDRIEAMKSRLGPLRTRLMKYGN